MKFMSKEFILGCILGACVLVPVSPIANVAYDITENPYKIVVDGEERSIDGYNINGYSYFKLRDIGDSVGFDVDFKNEVIQIKTCNNNSDVTIGDTTIKDKFYDAFYKFLLRSSIIVSGQPVGIIEYTGETYLEGGGVSMIGFIGGKAISESIVYQSIDFADDRHSMWMITGDGKKTPLTEKIPLYEINNYLYIKESDFNNIIKPQIDKILDSIKTQN